MPTNKPVEREASFQVVATHHGDDGAVVVRYYNDNENIPLDGSKHLEDDLLCVVCLEGRVAVEVGCSTFHTSVAGCPSHEWEKHAGRQQAARPCELFAPASAAQVLEESPHRTRRQPCQRAHRQQATGGTVLQSTRARSNPELLHAWRASVGEHPGPDRGSSAAALAPPSASLSAPTPSEHQAHYIPTPNSIPLSNAIPPTLSPSPHRLTLPLSRAQPPEQSSPARLCQLRRLPVPELPS
ncbi:hypothetical protein DFH27DRAFT_614368 [Peziza echinospora]|nr:hypothetical protein DFH27DRAFT_614368 [Peziza echinospora]